MVYLTDSIQKDLSLWRKFELNDTTFEKAVEGSDVYVRVGVQCNQHNVLSSIVYAREEEAGKHFVLVFMFHGVTLGYIIMVVFCIFKDISHCWLNALK